jgi:hypothetical protein
MCNNARRHRKRKWQPEGKLMPGQLDSPGERGACLFRHALCNALALLAAILPVRGVAADAPLFPERPVRWLVTLMSGQLAAMFFNTPAALTLVKSGKLRALGVSTARRSVLLPDAPTIAEAGVAGFDTSVWYGLLAPAGTPKAVISRMHRDVTAALRDEDVRKLLLNSGAEPVGSSPQEFAERVREETASWAKVIKAANIRVD